MEKAGAMRPGTAIRDAKSERRKWPRAETTAYREKEGLPKKRPTFFEKTVDSSGRGWYYT